MLPSTAETSEPTHIEGATGSAGVRRAVRRRQHQRVQVARDMGEQDEILHRAASLDAGGIADLEFGPGRVADCGFGGHVGFSATLTSLNS